jgi:NADPH:quinone reductase-like Zn-dependent oxidoreductase
MKAWTLTVARDDLSNTSLLEGEVPEVGEGEARLRVDRVGMTANNVTYAVMGVAMRYWDFFPTEPDLGLVPLWGFADVVASRSDGVEVGTRVYGYLPPSSHLLVQPVRVDERGFRDGSAHRQELPSPYNVYALTTADPAYEAHRENLQVLYRPLFYTSFMLADQLEDNRYFGADVLVLSSASSKTAYGAAFLLKGDGPEVVGLTSSGNVAFTESLGCYDRVVSYDAISDLDATRPTGYVDVLGSADVRTRLRDHLGKSLVHDAVVGITSQESFAAAGLTDPQPTFFFAPDQIHKRTGDWGREELDRRFGEAWQRFAPVVEDWVDVVEQHGPEALQSVWLEVLAGKSAPRTGNIITF